MKAGSIEAYLSELRGILGRMLSAQDADEIASETRNHLSERAGELEEGGITATLAEEQSVREFGDVQTIATEVAKGYPPKPPLDPSKLRWLPELGVTVILGLVVYSYSIYQGPRGFEAAAENLIPTTTMLVLPGMTSGLERLKFRRIRPISTLVRLANYGLGLNLAGTTILITLELTGRSTLTSTYPMFYLFSVASIILYAVMRTTFTNGKAYTYLRKRLKI